MRFFLDEDHSDRIAVMAQLRGVDIISVRQARRGGLTNEEQLLFAGHEGRCIVTRNAKHFAPLSRQFEVQGLPHAGVACVPDSLPGERFAAIVAGILRSGVNHQTAYRRTLSGG